MNLRDKFEAWAVTQWFAIHRNGGEQYVNTATQHAWAGWQAAYPQAMKDGFAVGWAEAADWADRNDLIADIGSPAYLKDRDAALANPEGEPS